MKAQDCVDHPIGSVPHEGRGTMTHVLHDGKCFECCVTRPGRCCIEFLGLY
jgi:hypothetical protein